MHSTKHGGEYVTSLLLCLEELVSSCTDLLIVGDFNMPDICWSSLMGSSPSSNTFCEFIYNNNLAQLVTNPTHTKGNILDLVITNADFVSDLPINPLCSLLPSDHFSITFTVKQSIPSY